MAEDLKECPKCAEMIKQKAVQCRFCGYQFQAEAPQTPPAPSPAAPAPQKTTAPERDFAEDIAEFENEQSKGKKVRKFFLFFFLFLGFGALGWFLTEYGIIDLVFHKLTSGRFKAALVYLDSAPPYGIREGRLGADAGGRGARERAPAGRDAARPAVPRRSLPRTDGAPVTVARNFVDVNALISAANSEPGHPNNNFNIGSGFLMNFNNPQAIDYLVKAVTDLPDDYEALTNLAVAYLREGLYDQARQEAEKALGINRENSLAVNVLGICALRKDLMTESLRHFQAVVTDDPQFADSYVNLGNVYAAQENLAMAKEKYQKALSLAGTHGVASQNLGALAYGERDYQNALKYWEQALDNTLLINDKAVQQLNKNVKIVQKKLL